MEGAQQETITDVHLPNDGVDRKVWGPVRPRHHFSCVYVRYCHVRASLLHPTSNSLASPQTEMRRRWKRTEGIRERERERERERASDAGGSHAHEWLSREDWEGKSRPGHQDEQCCRRSSNDNGACIEFCWCFWVA